MHSTNMVILTTVTTRLVGLLLLAVKLWEFDKKNTRVGLPLFWDEEIYDFWYDVPKI